MKTTLFTIGVLPALLAAQSNITPLIGLSVNGTGSPDIVRGWPAIVRVRLAHPGVGQPNASPVQVFAPGGWTNSLQITFTTDAGDSIPVSMTSVGPAASDSVTLDGQTTAAAMWVISPDATATWPTVPAHATAALTWNGAQIASKPVTFTPADPAGTLTPAQENWRVRLFAQYSLLTGATDSATALLDAHLAATTDDFMGLVLRGDVAANASDPIAAIRFYSRAWDAFDAANPNAKEPPIEVVQKMWQAFSALKAGADNPTPNSPSKTTQRR